MLQLKMMKLVVFDGLQSVTYARLELDELASLAVKIADQSLTFTHRAQLV